MLIGDGEYGCPAKGEINKEGMVNLSAPGEQVNFHSMQVFNWRHYVPLFC